MLTSSAGSINLLSTFLFILCDSHGLLATSLTRERTSQEATDHINHAFRALEVGGYGTTSSNNIDKSGVRKYYNKYGRTDIQPPLPLKSKSSIDNVWNVSGKGKFKRLFIHKPLVAAGLLEEKQKALIYRVFSSPLFKNIKEKKLNQTRVKCDKSVMCNICLKVLTEHTCLRLFTRHGLVDNNYTLLRFQQRKLLQEKGTLVGKDIQEINDADVEGEEKEEVVITEQLVVSARKNNPKNYMSSSERSQNLSQLIEELKRDVSKEPIWAMISVSFLMVVLVLAGKACGMRAIQKDRDIHIDVEHDFHNVSVMEVIRVKKRYLPKGFYRLKRKFRRKLKPRWIKEKDISEPLTDSSGEERLLYDRSNII